MLTCNFVNDRDDHPRRISPNCTYLLYLLFTVRAAKFISRKQWVICGADDLFIRVFNYNTMDKVKTFEAHTDYIRYHTKEQLLLSDD